MYRIRRPITGRPSYSIEDPAPEVPDIAMEDQVVEADGKEANGPGIILKDLAAEDPTGENPVAAEYPGIRDDPQRLVAE